MAGVRKSKVDLPRIEAALRRAARRAISGGDADRNGRFQPRAPAAVEQEVDEQKHARHLGVNDA
jgi:hypothetical protein